MSGDEGAMVELETVTHEPRVVLVCASEVETFAIGNKTLTSGIRKVPIEGAVRVSSSGLAGDGVGDTEHHGGPNRALHVFSAEAYDRFADRLDVLVPRPWVGENLVLRGYTDADARIGDVLRIGCATFVVTMPTERCANPGLVSGIGALRKWMLETLMTGFYLRVAEAGQHRRGAGVTVTHTDEAAPTVAALSASMYRPPDDAAADARMIAAVEAMDALAPEFKRRMRVLYERREAKR